VHEDVLVGAASAQLEHCPQPWQIQA
jgi:hypothetical protein